MAPRRGVCSPARGRASPPARSGAPTRRVPSPRFTARLVEDVRGAPAERCLHRVQRPLGVRRAAAGSAPGPADSPLRRGARGVQEHRRARRGLAARRRPRPRGATRHRRTRLAAAGGRGALARLSRPGRAPRLARARGGRGALDDATALVLPSWPEGLGRVVIEAFARGRGVVATDAAASRTSSRTASRACSSPRRTWRRSRRRSSASSPTASSRSGSARRPASGTRTGTRRRSSSRRHARARRPRSPARPADVRLIFVTQTLDAEHPVLAQTLDLVVRSRTAPRSRRPLRLGRPARPARQCARAGRSAPDRGSAAASASRAPPRRAAARAAATGRRARAHGPALPRPRRAAREAAARPAAALVHALARGTTLRLATRLADVVLSVDRRSFPLARRRCAGSATRSTSSGSRPRRPRRPRPLRLLALGRTARWKGYDTMLAALELAVEPGSTRTLEIRGPQLTDDERAHRQELEAIVAASRRLRARVRIEPPVPRAELPALLAAADALVSATQPRGSETLDKVVYEAAACGVPVLASNTALDEFLGGLPVELRFPPRDAGSSRSSCSRSPRPGRSGARDAGAELRRRVVEATRSTRGRTPSRRRCRPDPRVRSGRGDRAHRAARSRSRDRDVRAARPYVLSRGTCAPLVRRVLGDRRARLRSTRSASRSASTPRSSSATSSSATRSSGACSGRRARGVAAVPDPDHAARLLAGGPLRLARAARRVRPGRLLAVLVAAITLAFGWGTDYDFTTSGLIPTACVTCALVIGPLRAAYESFTVELQRLLHAPPGSCSSARERASRRCSGCSPRRAGGSRTSSSARSCRPSGDGLVERHRARPAATRSS